MTPEQLKSCILLSAIQGKIVEQKSVEGSGEDLYNLLQKEKSELISEGEVKKVDLEKIEDEELPFDIPSSWKWVRHNDLFEIVGGSQPPKSYFKDKPDEGDVRLYQIRDYGETPVPVYVDGKLVSKFTEEGDILLARYGGSLGKVFWAKEGAYNVAMAKIVMLYKTDLIDKNFLYYYYLAPLYQNLVKGSNRAAQGGFNKDDLNALLFPLPPLEEQHRIVAKIEELLPFVDRYAASWEKLKQFNAKFPEEMKKSILQYAIQGKLVEQRAEEGCAEDLYQQIQEEKQKLIKEGKIKKEKPLAEITEDEIPFDIPESWKWCRLSQIIDVRDGTHDSPKYVPEGIPLVTSKNLTDGTIDYGNIKYITQTDADKINERSAVNDNDILFAMIGSIGNPVLVKKDREFCIKNMALFKKYENTNMDMNYMYWFFYYAQYALKAEASGGVQSFISLTRFREYLVPLPPLAEQGRIAKKFEEMLPYCERLVK